MQFRSTSNLNQVDQTRQIDTLLYCMGDELEEVLASLIAEEEDQEGEQRQQQTYDSVMEKFKKFFSVQKNLLFKRARFNRRNEASDESAEEYIMALYKPAEDCEYGNLKSEMI